MLDNIEARPPLGRVVSPACCSSATDWPTGRIRLSHEPHPNGWLPIGFGEAISIQKHHCYSASSRPAPDRGSLDDVVSSPSGRRRVGSIDLLDLGSRTFLAGRTLAKNGHNRLTLRDFIRFSLPERCPQPFVNTDFSDPVESVAPVRTESILKREARSCPSELTFKKFF